MCVQRGTVVGCRVFIWLKGRGCVREIFQGHTYFYKAMPIFRCIKLVSSLILLYLQDFFFFFFWGGGGGGGGYFPLGGKYQVPAMNPGVK